MPNGSSDSARLGPETPLPPPPVQPKPSATAPPGGGVGAPASSSGGVTVYGAYSTQPATFALLADESCGCTIMCGVKNQFG